VYGCRNIDGEDRPFGDRCGLPLARRMYMVACTPCRHGGQLYMCSKSAMRPRRTGPNRPLNLQSRCATGLPRTDRPWILIAHPNKGWVLRTKDGSSNATTTSVLAGQRMCGAPRRNRTGDPILTMNLAVTAVRTAISPAHARPLGPKLSVLFRRSYAFSQTYSCRLASTLPCLGSVDDLTVRGS
jgi:hypothetical protein